MAAAALMEADAIAESERTAAAMQAREWGSGVDGERPIHSRAA